MRVGPGRMLSTVARLGGIALLVLVPAARAAAAPASEAALDLLAGSPGAVLPEAIGAGAGTYGLTVMPAISNFGVSSDYTWTFTVAPANTAVLEPASMVLFGTGLIASVRGFRRR
jgi:hypothetical protein